jgi:protein subunit release factor B
MLFVPPNIRIADDELKFTFVRSSGPGGQNVNKVNSKAVLRWNALASTGLPDAVRQRFITRFGGRLTEHGDLVLTSQRYRDHATRMTAWKSWRRCLQLWPTRQSGEGKPNPRGPASSAAKNKSARPRTRSSNAVGAGRSNTHSFSSAGLIR